MQQLSDRAKSLAYGQAGQGGVEYVLVTILAATVVGIFTLVAKGGGLENLFSGIIDGLVDKVTGGGK